MKKIITKDFVEAFSTVKELVDKREKILKEKHFVIVPDKCTVFLEGLLFDKKQGAFDVEVLSISRLCKKLLPLDRALLPTAGAVMLIKKIATENKHSLKAFKKTTKFIGFAEKVYASISSLMLSGIMPNDLEGFSGLNGLKMSDIASIYDKFLQETHSKAVDVNGEIILLAQKLNKEAVSNIHFYVAGFDRLSKIEEQLLGKIASLCKSFTKIETQNLTISYPDDVVLFESPSLSQRVIEAAKIIEQEIKNGESPTSFCVLLSPESDLTATRILSEFSIPYYLDKEIELSHTALFRLLNDSLNCNFLAHEIIDISKNYFLKIDKQNSDALEDYILLRGINFKNFLSEFDCEKAEKARRIVVEFIDFIKEGLQSVKCARDFYLFIERFLLTVNAKDGLKELSRVSQMELSVIETAFLEVASLVETIEDKSTAFFYDLFASGVAATKLSPLPAYCESVVVGRPESFRGGRFKTIFVLDFNEKKIPIIQRDKSLLSAVEGRLLKKRGKTLSPTQEELNTYSLNEVQRLFSNANSLFLSYSSHGGEAISSLAYDIKNYKKHRVAVSTSTIKVKRPKISDASLFFKKGVVSISRIQAYFSCPYKSFAKNMLGLSEKDDGEIKPFEVGNFLHEVAKIFALNNDFNNANINKKVLEICQSLFLKDSYSFLKSKNPHLCARIENEAIECCRLIARSFYKGQYKLFGAEMSFGEPLSGLSKTVEFKVGDKNLRLLGSIDRVDIFENYIRVIDYKTGSDTKFESALLYQGVSVQLPLYLKALHENGFQLAGAFYFPLKYIATRANSHILIGPFNEAVYFSHDEGLLKNNYESDIIYAKTTKNGLLNQQRSSVIYSACDLLKIMHYAKKVSQTALEEIANGFITPTPFEGACKYCLYFSVCGFNKADETVRSKLQESLCKNAIQEVDFYEP